MIWELDSFVSGLPQITSRVNPVELLLWYSRTAGLCPDGAIKRVSNTHSFVQWVTEVRLLRRQGWTHCKVACNVPEKICSLLTDQRSIFQLFSFLWVNFHFGVNCLSNLVVSNDKSSTENTTVTKKKPNSDINRKKRNHNKHNINGKGFGRMNHRWLDKGPVHLLINEHHEW